MNERALWEETHRNMGYSGRIFSLLDSPLVRDKFLKEMKLLQFSSSPVRILIPGCGSNISIQVWCKEVFGDNAIIDALDWSKEAIRISKKQSDNLGIDVNYINQSYYELSLEHSSLT